MLIANESYPIASIGVAVVLKLIPEATDYSKIDESWVKL